MRDYRTNPSGVSYLVSYGVGGTQVPTWDSTRPQLDDSGDIVAFVSNSPGIVSGDTNGHEDSFIRNWALERRDGPDSHTTSLGVTPTGGGGDCPGMRGGDEGHQPIVTRPYLSGDGNTVVFVSGDCNLTPDAAHGGPDTNLVTDIFVRRFGAAVSCLRTAGPARLLDTRSGGPLVAGGTRVVGVAGSLVPLGAAAAVLNVVATQTAAPGYVTVWPAGQPRPLASNVNADRTGETIAGSGDGAVERGGVGGDLCVDDDPSHRGCHGMGGAGVWVHTVDAAAGAGHPQRGQAGAQRPGRCGVGGRRGAGQTRRRWR